jgi:hypothetical protein
MSRFGTELVLSAKKIQPSLSIRVVRGIASITQKTGGTEGFCGMNTGGADVMQPELVM